MEHKAKLFKSGQSQAVRLTKKFSFNSEHVYIRRDDRSGKAIAELDLLIAARAQSLGVNLISNDARLKSLQQITVIDWRE